MKQTVWIVATDRNGEGTRATVHATEAAAYAALVTKFLTNHNDEYKATGDKLVAAGDFKAITHWLDNDVLDENITDTYDVSSHEIELPEPPTKPENAIYLANRFQDLFDSIQDGDTFGAMQDVKQLCYDITGIEIDDEHEDNDDDDEGEEDDE